MAGLLGTAFPIQLGFAHRNLCGNSNTAVIRLHSICGNQEPIVAIAKQVKQSLRWGGCHLILSYDTHTCYYHLVWVKCFLTEHLIWWYRVVSRRQDWAGLCMPSFQETVRFILINWLKNKKESGLISGGFKPCCSSKLNLKGTS